MNFRSYKKNTKHNNPTISLAKSTDTEFKGVSQLLLVSIPQQTAMTSSSPSHTTQFCVRRLKVLSDTTRLSILRILMLEPKHVGELEMLLEIEQSLLSHHLQVLRREGFVTSTRDGKAVLYQLSPEFRTNSGDAIDLGCCLLSFSDEK
jgi:ArsR family transcriptional regulator